MSKRPPGARRCGRRLWAGGFYADSGPGTSERGAHHPGRDHWLLGSQQLPQALPQLPDKPFIRVHRKRLLQSDGASLCRYARQAQVAAFRAGSQRVGYRLSGGLTFAAAAYPSLPASPPHEPRRL